MDLTPITKLHPLAGVAALAVALAGYTIYSSTQVETSILTRDAAAIQALSTAATTAAAENREFRGEMRRHWGRSEQIHQHMTNLLRVICTELSNGQPQPCYSDGEHGAD